MSVQFQCPYCNSVRSVNERALGRELNCPDCGNSVLMPTLEEWQAQQISSDHLAEESEHLTEEVVEVVEVVDPEPVAAEVVEAATVVDAVNVVSGGVKTAPSERTETPEERLKREERELAAATTKFSRPRPSSEEDMDMTPMVDVTFLLLIFFMVTASFSVQKSIQRPAQRNEDPSMNTVQQPEEENPDVVTVQVDEFNSYNVITADWDQAAASKQDLILALNRAHEGNGGGQQPSKLIIEAHEDCIHASVVAALDAGREALFESFEVSTVEQFD